MLELLSSRLEDPAPLVEEADASVGPQRLQVPRGRLGGLARGLERGGGLLGFPRRVGDRRGARVDALRGLFFLFLRR